MGGYFDDSCPGDPGQGFFATDCEPGSCYDRGSFFIDLCAEPQCQIDCRPYACDALLTEYSLVTYPEGTSVATWDFLDYYDNTAAIPDEFRKSWGQNDGLNWKMRCSVSGQSWGGGDSRIGASNLNQTPGTDLDQCQEWDNGGLVAACTNHRATNKPNHAWSFEAPGIQPWGSTMTNVNLAFVSKSMGFGSGSSNVSARLWQGFNQWSAWSETGPTVSGYTSSIWCGRDTSPATKHYIVFDYTRNSQYYVELPFGEFNQNLATLWQVGVSYSNIRYIAGDYQDYFKASYHVYVDVTFYWTLTRIDGYRFSGTHTMSDVIIFQIFDHTKGSAVPGESDIDEAYKLKATADRTDNSYFSGSLGVIYNVAAAHRTDGLSGPDVNINTLSPGSASSPQLETAFTRNQINYTLPPECPEPQP